MISPARYLRTYVALMLLLAATYGLARLDLGAFGTPVALAIAALKAGLVLATFMHLRVSGTVVRAAAAIGAVWLAILITLVLSDYRGRDRLPLPGDWPQDLSPRSPGSTR